MCWLSLLSQSIDHVLLHALGHRERERDAHRDGQPGEVQECERLCTQLLLVVNIRQVGPMACHLVVPEYTDRDGRAPEADLHNAIADNARDTGILDLLQQLLAVALLLSAPPIALGVAATGAGPALANSAVSSAMRLSSSAAVLGGLALTSVAAAGRGAREETPPCAALKLASGGLLTFGSWSRVVSISYPLGTTTPTSPTVGATAEVATVGAAV